MDRRVFLKQSSAATLGAATVGAGLLKRNPASAAKPDHPFHLKYSIQPHWFSNLSSMEDRLRRIHDEGFLWVENNGFRKMSPDDQKKYAQTLETLGMEHGIFVANRGVNGGAGVVNPKEHEIFVREIRASIEVAPLIHAKYMTVCTGNALPGLPRERQHRNVVEGLKKVVEPLEKAGLVIVVENLNTTVDHHGYYLDSLEEGYRIAKEVGSPSVKLLCDLYHLAVMEGNIIEKVRKYMDEIAYFQFADVPGRHEPGTGEINYRNVFKAIYDAGYRGFMGAELRPSKGTGEEGTLAVLNAIRECDSWTV